MSGKNPYQHHPSGNHVRHKGASGEGLRGDSHSNQHWIARHKAEERAKITLPMQEPRCRWCLTRIGEWAGLCESCGDEAKAEAGVEPAKVPLLA